MSALLPVGPDDVANATRQILSWWVRRPAAKDTALGITMAWLDSPSGSSLGAVEEALDQLVERGWVRWRSIPNSPAIFGVVAGELPAIEKFLGDVS